MLLIADMSLIIISFFKIPIHSSSLSVEDLILLKHVLGTVRKTDSIYLFTCITIKLMGTV